VERHSSRASLARLVNGAAPYLMGAQQQPMRLISRRNNRTAGIGESVVATPHAAQCFRRRTLARGTLRSELFYVLSRISRLLPLDSFAWDGVLCCTSGERVLVGRRDLQTHRIENAAAPESRGKDPSPTLLNCDANATIPNKTHAGWLLALAERTVTVSLALAREEFRGRAVLEGGRCASQ